MDLAVAFEHLQHQTEVGCPDSPWAVAVAWSQHSDSGGAGSVSRQEAAAWESMAQSDALSDTL